jgi:hypothetical protein
MVSATYAVAHPTGPKDGESYASFVRRAHGELMQLIPDPDTRNRAVWNAWESIYGNPLRDRAMEFFPSDKYQHVPGVCYFMEHQTKGRDGTPLNYGFNELAQLVNTNNERADTDAYSAIASHHTSDGMKGPKHEPHTIGFAGPYSLGMVGRLNPKFAVFADEHHRIDEADLFDRRRRRSVEVMRFKDGRPSYFDPIATLGADSPRLALPVARYEQEDAMVERYSVVSPVSVGGGSSNTFIPGYDKQKYGQEQPGGDQAMMSSLGEADIQSIVQAIRNTPEMQWVQTQITQAVPMGEQTEADKQADLSQQPMPGQQAPQGGQPPAMPAPEMNSMVSPPMVPPQSYGLPPSAAGAASGQSQPYSQKYSLEEEDEVSTERYQALESEYESLAERYSQLSEVNGRMMESHAQLKTAVVQLERRAVDSDRTLRIKDLYQQFPHFVDENEECERCLYSAGSTMTNDEFEAHLAAVEKYAQRVPAATKMIPSGSGESNDSGDKFIYDKVLERYHQLETQGVYRDWNDLEAEIKKEHGIN